MDKDTSSGRMTIEDREKVMDRFGRTPEIIETNLDKSLDRLEGELGSLIDSLNNLEAKVEAAVLAERERCAKIAEGIGIQFTQLGVRSKIAKRIRSGK